MDTLRDPGAHGGRDGSRGKEDCKGMGAELRRWVGQARSCDTREGRSMEGWVYVM